MAEERAEPKVVLLVRLLSAIDEGRFTFEELKDQIAEEKPPSTRTLRRYLSVLADAGLSVVLRPGERDVPVRPRLQSAALQPLAPRAARTRDAEASRILARRDLRQRDRRDDGEAAALQRPAQRGRDRERIVRDPRRPRRDGRCDRARLRAAARRRSATTAACSSATPTRTQTARSGASTRTASSSRRAESTWSPSTTPATRCASSPSTTSPRSR